MDGGAVGVVAEEEVVVALFVGQAEVVEEFVEEVGVAVVEVEVALVGAVVWVRLMVSGWWGALWRVTVRWNWSCEVGRARPWLRWVSARWVRRVLRVSRCSLVSPVVGRLRV
ncbi:hypothetical protein [Streptomyces sp. NRRL F-6676]|uniref:hypothetical protein n=1 Tax=Streptomyces sp. NRRL F-6676 TaxID=1463878 RepID=UPI001F1FE3F0|nr:hypothetical protein [Streptomyces sp. NRRL F-6676]